MMVVVKLDNIQVQGISTNQFNQFILGDLLIIIYQVLQFTGQVVARKHILIQKQTQHIKQSKVKAFKQLITILLLKSKAVLMRILVIIIQMQLQTIAPVYIQNHNQLQVKPQFNLLKHIHMSIMMIQLLLLNGRQKMEQ